MMPIKRKFNLKTITKPTNKLRKLLVHPKDSTPKERRSHVIYSIPFTDGQVYIGETSWPLETRLKEHRDAIKSWTPKRAPLLNMLPQHHQCQSGKKHKSLRKRQIGIRGEWKKPFGLTKKAQSTEIMELKKLLNTGRVVINSNIVPSHTLHLPFSFLHFFLYFYTFTLPVILSCSYVFYSSVRFFYLTKSSHYY